MEWVHDFRAKVQTDYDAAEAHALKMDEEYTRASRARSDAIGMRNTLHSLLQTLRDLDRSDLLPEPPL